MFNKPSPVKEMLIRELREVKILIQDVKEKIETIDMEKALTEKHPKEILDKPE